MENVYRLDQDCELRFEVEGKHSVELVLESGKAEIFGTELAVNRKYTFSSGSKVAVFTWFSAIIKISRQTEGTYIARETPMVMYLNTHACLEKLRINAEESLQTDSDTRGPVVMIVGPADVGKSTLCRILLNYAVRRGRRPIYVDLDIGQGAIGVPGCMGALLVERTATVEEGFSQDAPLVFSFGHVAPEANMTMYNILVSRMASVVHEKMITNRKVAASGVIINTCGWVKDDGYKSLKHVAQSFEVDVIIVLDQERLYNDLVKDISFIKVVFLPKSGGVVERNRATRIKARDDRIHEYFYGSKTKYHPHSFDVSYEDLKIFKIGAPALPKSCLPADTKTDDHMTKLVPIEPSQKIKHNILALSLASSQEDILKTNVSGFICVLDVDENKKSMTILSPQPSPLSKAFLILTEILFMDSH